MVQGSEIEPVQGGVPRRRSCTLMRVAFLAASGCCLRKLLALSALCKLTLFVRPVKRSGTDHCMSFLDP